MEMLEVIQGLKRILKGERVQKFIDAGLRSLKPSDVKQAINQNYQLSKLVFNHFHLSHKAVAPLARFVLKMYWNDLEKHLTNVSEIYKVLSARPDIKKILDTPKGRRWMNSTCRQLYYDFYRYVWKGEYPYGEVYGTA